MPELRLGKLGVKLEVGKGLLDTAGVVGPNILVDVPGPVEREGNVGLGVKGFGLVVVKGFGAVDGAGVGNRLLVGKLAGLVEPLSPA